MKKLVLCFVISCLFLFSSCQSPEAPQTTDPSDSSPSATEIKQTQDVGNTDRVYLSADPSQSEAYNEAITAYNGFLSGKSMATRSEPNGEKKTEFFIHEMIQMDGGSGIEEFSLKDLNGDDIPELIVRPEPFLKMIDVFFYHEEKLSLVHSINTGTEGDVSILKNGAIFSYRGPSDSVNYVYTVLEKDGKAVTTSFGGATPEYSDSVPNPYYYFQDHDKISKESWEEQTKPYFAAAEQKADLEWLSWKTEAQIH